MPEGEAKSTAQETLGELDQLLTELTDIAGQQDVERFDRGVAMALDATSRLRVLQAPGLPFDLPRRYDALPRLTAWGGGGRGRGTTSDSTRLLFNFLNPPLPLPSIRFLLNLTSAIHLFIRILYRHHAASVKPDGKRL